jgi:hypothetical protein
MQQEIVNKYGKEVLKNFWIFIENLNFDGKTQESSSVRASILKKLSPSIAEKYKEIGDELAFSLYREVFYDKTSTYLYAAFEAVSKGSDFYEKCWLDETKIESILSSVDQFNNFSTVLPTEDDYFHLITPTAQSVLDEFDEYDEYLESVGNKKGKKTKNKKTDHNDE